MPKWKKIEVYPLERSPLYQLLTHKALAGLLDCRLSALKKLVASKNDHYWRKTEEINGKERHIVCPFGRMRRIHERLAALLNRIEQPDWLSSPRHKMTTVKSTAKHLGGRRYVSLDIRKFYPSTTDEHIFRLFHHVFQMPDDVAGTLTQLVTSDGRVPFGSPLSPILCAVAHRGLFDEIDRHCKLAEVVPTVWVDDIIVSGEQVSSSLLFKIKGAIKHKGLSYHKVQRRKARRGMVMTGVHVSKRGQAPSYKSHTKMRDGLALLKTATLVKDRLAIVRSLLGQNAYMAHVYCDTDPRRKRLLSQRQWLHNERRALERTLNEQQGNQAEATNPIARKTAGSDDQSAPF